MGRDKILDRINSLLAHADSAQDFDSIAEAEAFAAKAQSMMLKHKVADKELMSRLDAEDAAKRFEGITRVYYYPRDWGHTELRKRSAWKERLARVIADGFQCRFLVITGSNRLVFVGLEADAVFSVQLFARLVDLFERQSLREYDRAYNKLYDQGLPTHAVRGFKRSFLDSAADGLHDRLQEQLIAAVTGTALIRLKNVVIEYIAADKDVGKAASLTAGVRNSEGSAAGYAFGRSVSVHTGGS